MGVRRVSLAFRGGVWGSLGYSLLFMVSIWCVIPAPWGAAAFLRWGAEHTERDDGGLLRFEGRGSQVWPLFFAWIVLSILPQVAMAAAGRSDATGVTLVLTLVLLPLTAAVVLAVYRWAVAGVRLEPGGTARLTASYVGYLGWSVFLLASVCTIIGWAWVFVAMLRWMARHVAGDGYGLEFIGTGWGLLWRSVVWSFGIIFLIPIPWVLRAMYAWFIENTVLLVNEGA